MQNDDDTKLNSTDETPAKETVVVDESVAEEPVTESDASLTDQPADNESTSSTEPSETEAAVEESVSEEGPVEETTEEPTTPVADEPVADERPGKWYVVHTYSGHENKVAAALRQKIEAEYLEDKIIDILVPTQNKIEIKGGRKIEVKEKIFPGYILVRMVLEDTSWLAVRSIPGVTSFIGMGNKPTVIPDREVETIIKYSKIEQPSFKQVFEASDTVKIVDGPFAEMIGKIDSVDTEKGKVRVLVSIFGRETPVELDFLQVQKI